MGRRYEKNKRNVSENKQTLEKLHSDKDTLQNEYTPLSLLDSIQGLLDDEATDAIQSVRAVGEIESQRLDAETSSAEEEKKQIAGEINAEIAKLNAGLEKLRRTGSIEFGKSAVEKGNRDYKIQIDKLKALKAELLESKDDFSPSTMEHIVQQNAETIESLFEDSDTASINEHSATNTIINSGSVPSHVTQKEHRPLVSSRKDAINAVLEDVKHGSGRTITEEQAEAYYDSVQIFSGQDMTGNNNDYRGIRDAYNNPNASSEDKERLKNLDDYITSAPKWEGEIYRGINVDKKTANSILMDSEVDMLGPASWSSDFDTAERFSRGSKPVRMIFVLPENKSGASITHIASYDGMESEITSPSGVKYSINDHQTIVKDGREYLYVYLSE